MRLVSINSPDFASSRFSHWSAPYHGGRAEQVDRFALDVFVCSTSFAFTRRNGTNGDQEV